MNEGETEFFSRHGAPLRRITFDEYESQKAQAVSYDAVMPNEYYTAYVSTYQFQQQGEALRFDVYVKRSRWAPTSPFALTSFTLLLLNDDYHPVSSHKAEIHQDKYWFLSDADDGIAVQAEGINVRTQEKRHIIETIHKGFLLSYQDDGYDELFKPKE